MARIVPCIREFLFFTVELSVGVLYNGTSFLFSGIWKSLFYLKPDMPCGTCRTAWVTGAARLACLGTGQGDRINFCQ